MSFSRFHVFIFKFPAFVLLLVSSEFLGCASTAPSLSFDERYAMLQAISDGKDVEGVQKQRHSVTVGEIATAYIRLGFSKVDKLQLKLVSVDELRAIFNANYIAAFYSNAPMDNVALSNALEEMEHRELERVGQVKMAYSAFTRSRDFIRAQALAQRYPIIPFERLPKFNIDPLVYALDQAEPVLGSAPTEWVFSQTERLATRRLANLNGEWLMLVVSHPKCRFSYNAAHAIYTDTELTNRLKNNAKWILGQSNDFEFDAFQKWNKQHPDVSITLVHRDSEWPLESLSATPTFYFLQNGKVVESFSGWPKDGSHKAKLIAALDRIAQK